MWVSMPADEVGRPGPAVEDLASRLADVRRRIEGAASGSGRHLSDIRLIAVTKTHGAVRVRDANACGLIDVGENYVQEAVRKADELGEQAGLFCWHLIGPLQSNKLGSALGLFKWIHSVDRFKLLDAISVRLGDRADVRLLIQVNLESGSVVHPKHGFKPADVADALMRAGELGLPVRGLMTMPPLFDDPEKTRPYYRALRELRDNLAGEGFGSSVSLDELSMGMSNDFETAVEEGATMVRVGTALFGPRGKRG